jgi:hypothetical protein
LLNAANSQTPFTPAFFSMRSNVSRVAIDHNKPAFPAGIGNAAATFPRGGNKVNESILWILSAEENDVNRKIVYLML